MEASSSPSTTQHDTFEARLQQRIATTMSDRSLEMSTANPGTHVTHGGRLPNTPLTVSTISFLLGSLFTLGLSTFLAGGANFWWTTPQLSFFAAAWAAFHWAEFAVTAGWNRGRCNVDCELSSAILWCQLILLFSFLARQWDPIPHCTFICRVRILGHPVLCAIVEGISIYLRNRYEL